MPSYYFVFCRENFKLFHGSSFYHVNLNQVLYPRKGVTYIEIIILLLNSCIGTHSYVFLLHFINFFRLKADQKDAANHLILSVHLQLQNEGFLSTWTNSFVGPWDPSQGAHNPGWCYLGF